MWQQNCLTEPQFWSGEIFLSDLWGASCEPNDTKEPEKLSKHTHVSFCLWETKDCLQALMLIFWNQITSLHAWSVRNTRTRFPHAPAFRMALEQQKNWWQYSPQTDQQFLCQMCLGHPVCPNVQTSVSWKVHFCKFHVIEVFPTAPLDTVCCCTEIVREKKVQC